jgi:hypothetical protein
MARIETMADLRRIYIAAKGRAVEKELDRLEKHSRRLIELSPFLIIGTMGADGLADVSPRGEAPGFVQVLDDETVAIPDRPGNNRLDTLGNILDNPAVALIFLIPGMDEVLRINGMAQIRDDDDLRQRFAVKGKLPATVLVVKIKQLYLHCPKAIMRAGLWDAATHIDRKTLPTLGRMIADQINSTAPAEGQAEMVARYKTQLY